MYIVIFITASNRKEAAKISEKLIKEKLAACVNIVDKVESRFRWQGKVDKASEALLIVKSKKVKFTKIIKAVKSTHSYDCPEIIAIPIICGYAPYLDWIDESVR
jgi:periplasmic divalent cation tolerance protein